MSTITAPSREAWLEERKKAIGASEVASVLGVSPHKSAAALFYEKVGLVEPDDLDGLEWIKWGNRLQVPIGLAFGEETGRLVKPEPDNTVRRSAVYPWLAASLDFEQEAEGKPGPGALEVKTSDAFLRKMWDQGPPLHYQVQLQAQMLVCGLQWGSIAVLMGGNKLRHWDFERNERFQEAMIHRTREFWRCVETGMPPDIDGSISTANALAKLFPHDDGTAVMLADEWIQRTERLEKITRLITRLKRAKDEITNELMATVGTASYALLSDGTLYSTKEVKVPGRTQIIEPYSYRYPRKTTKALPRGVRVIDAESAETATAIESMYPSVVAECEEATESLEAVEEVSFRKHRRLRTYRQQKLVLFRRNPHCHWCGAKQKLRTTTIEHVIPLAAGGSNEMENLALACRKCNEEHGDGLSAPSSN